MSANIAAIPRNVLPPDEAARLAELEPIIKRGLSSFFEVGNALVEISDRRLYRQTHSTFKDYVEEKWKMSVRHAYRLCESAEIIKALPENVTHGTHFNERQVRELAKVPAPEKRLKVLKAVQAKGEVTAKAIKEARLEIERPPNGYTMEDFRADLQRILARCAKLGPASLMEVAEKASGGSESARTE